MKATIHTIRAALAVTAMLAMCSASNGDYILSDYEAGYSQAEYDACRDADESTNECEE
jgi:hypothetical protein